jgi:hypothetical protein
MALMTTYSFSTAGKSGIAVNGTKILVLLTAPQDPELKETKNE